MNSKRQLAAILFADIQGYTRLMQQDGQQASLHLRYFQKQMEKMVASHNGRIVNFYGDGALCIFQIPIEAVHCAMDLQKAFNGDLKTPVRLGIHSGTITMEGDKVFGDSINITSRIESMGIPGSVLLSKKVRDDVKNNPDLKLQSLGSFEFKNVEEAIEVFALANEGFSIPKQTEIKGKLKPQGTKRQTIWKPIAVGLALAGLIFAGYSWFATKSDNSSSNLNWDNSESAGPSDKSIAVLPFDDMSPGKDQEYFSDGMVEEILNHLVKIKGLQVSSRNSSMYYKESKKQTKDVAQELGVGTILQGSVRKAGEVLRITVQLIDGKTDRHIWSQAYDGKLDSVFAFQSSIARRVAKELKAHVASDVQQRIGRIPTHNMKAYSLYLEASRSGYATDKTKELLLEAIELDSSFADAYVLLAVNKLFRVIVSRLLVPEDLESYLNEAKALFKKSLELDPNNATALRRLGSMALWFEWDFAKATKYFEKSVQLEPALNEEGITEYLLSLGKFDEALQNSFLTVKANPNSAYSILVQGLCYYFTNDLQLAKQSVRLAEEKMDSIDIFSDGNIYRLLIFLEDYPEVLKKYKNLIKDQPSSSPRINSLAAIAYHYTGETKEVQKILQELKMQQMESPVGSPAFHIAMIYAQTGDHELAFEWLEKAYRSHEVEMYWLKVEPPFRPLYNDPKWQEMLDKVGFPES